MLRRLTLALLLTFAASSTVFAEQWASKLFKETKHDFGTLAKDAKAVYRFEVSNVYLDDIHIASVRSSCGCTSVSVENASLKTHEKGAVVASINTDRFFGQRGATLTVTLDKPYYAEYQLHVSANIRTDVTFEPGSVQLGSVEQGTEVQRDVEVNYSGHGNWKIVKVQSSDPNITSEIKQVSRNNGQAAYKLHVRLGANAPAGYIQDHLMLVTSDSEQIPLAIEGVVKSPITVSPASLFMGVVKPGEKVTKQLVVKGSKPFRILSISCDDQSYEFDLSAEGEPKQLHMIPVTFLAGADVGKVTDTIHIVTDLGDNKPELSAYAVVEGH
jgi:hypothetical protein